MEQKRFRLGKCGSGAIMPSRMIFGKLQSHRERLIAYSILLLIHIMLAILFMTDRTPGTDAAWTGVPLDDAWIHLVYGQAVAHHGVPYYNDGVPEAGFTSPLWMILLALADLIASLLSAPVVVIAKLFGVLLSWGASVGVYELCRRFGASVSIALPAAVLAAANPMTAFAQVSGMEVALTSAAMVWAMVFFASDRVRMSGIMLGLAYWSRPECLLMIPLFLAVRWFMQRKEPIRDRVQESVLLLLPTIVAAVAWSVYCLSVSGHFLPNTFYVKYVGADVIAGSWTIFKEMVFGMPSMRVIVGGVLLTLGALALVRRREGVSLLMFAIPWAFLLGIALTRPMPPGCSAFFYWCRYAAPALPLLFVPIAVGAASIVDPTSLFPSARLPKQASKWLPWVAVMIVLACFAEYPAGISRSKMVYAWNCQNINEMQVEVGKWVKRNVPREASILSIDAGAIKYFGERRTIDILGLNNHELLFSPELMRRIGTEPDSLASYMRSIGAAHYIIFPGLRPSWVNQPAFQSLFSSVAEAESRNYTVASDLQKKIVVYGLNR